MRYKTKKEKQQANKLMRACACRKYYLKNRRKIIKQNRKWATENEEKCRTYKEKYVSNPINYEKIKKRNSRWAANNPTKACNLVKKYRIRHLEQVQLREVIYRANSKDKISERGKRWKARNSHRVKAYISNRHQFLIFAKPKWANDEKIEWLYNEARRITKETGIRHDVDHIVPLINKRVCGLHCEDNLRILDHSKNSQKNNTF